MDDTTDETTTTYSTEESKSTSIDIDGDIEFEPGEPGEQASEPVKKVSAKELQKYKKIREVRGPEISEGWWLVGTDTNGKTKTTKPAYRELAHEFQTEHCYKTIAENRMTYIYDLTHWVHWDTAWLEDYADKMLDPKPFKTHIAEFVSIFARTNIIDLEDFRSKGTGLVNLQNGVYNIEENKLEPHDLKHYFQHVLPYDYDEAATCPRFEQFLDEVTDGRHDLSKILVEFMGYSIADGECYAAKALILTGKGSNGKSVFMDLLKALVGEGNYSSMSLSALNNDQKRAELEGKLVNIGEETNEKALGESEVFKTMVTGGDLDVKRVYCEPYTIKNRSKLIISCNTLPKSSDRTFGLYRRMLMIPFDVEFTGKSEDMFILSKLKAELPGILNLVIEGYKRLKSNNFRFTRSKVIEDKMEEYKAENDNIISWLNDNCVLDSTRETSTTALYSNYKAYCEDGGSYGVPRQTLMKRLKREVPGYQRIQKRVQYKRDWFIIGIRIDTGI